MNDQGADVQGNQGFSAGIFLVDKPREATSFSVVRDVRRLLGIKKVGHAGTLDPFATGLLIICAGRPATKLIERFMSGKKVYRALLQLGQETDTLDPEGEVVSTGPVPVLSNEEIKVCLAGLVGKQQQVPPQYSAAKHKGKPLYHYARRGIEVIKEPKEIEIFSLDFNDYNPGTHRLEIEVTCSRGTYIRVLAADIGKKLGSCAHLIELRRLSSGRYSVVDSISGDLLKKPEGQQALLTGMLSVESVMAMLDEEVSAQESVTAEIK